MLGRPDGLRKSRALPFPTGRGKITIVDQRGTRMVASSGVLRAVGFMLIALFPTAGSAQGTAEQRFACTGDAFRFCGPQIPNIPAITACMRANYPNLTPACRAQFDRPAKRNR